MHSGAFIHESNFGGLPCRKEVGFGALRRSAGKESVPSRRVDQAAHTRLMPAIGSDAHTRSHRKINKVIGCKSTVRNFASARAL